MEAARKDAYNLQLHGLPLELDRPNLKVNANSRDIALGVCVVCEPEEEARLGRAGVSGGDGEQRGQTLPTPESPMSKSLKR